MFQNKNYFVEMCDSDPNDVCTPIAKIPPPMNEMKQCCQTFSVFLESCNTTNDEHFQVLLKISDFVRIYFFG